MNDYLVKTLAENLNLSSTNINVKKNHKKINKKINKKI
jgi:hypothetical protein